MTDLTGLDLSVELPIQLDHSFMRISFRYSAMLHQYKANPLTKIDVTRANLLYQELVQTLVAGCFTPYIEITVQLNQRIWILLSWQENNWLIVLVIFLLR